MKGLEAMWMAIKGLIHENNRLIKVRVFCGSQTALQSNQSAKTNHSLGLLKFLRGKITKATLLLHWIPDYEGIRGSVRANELA